MALPEPSRRTWGRPPSHARWALVPLALAALVLPLVSLSGLPGAAAATTSYVALGDSYTSGPDIPAQSGSPAGCLRSNHNYPSDVASALTLILTDVSCSGATTADMTSPQSVSPGPANPPQLDAVVPGTQAVSLQVGGDDLGFTSIIENCVALTPWGPTKVGLNCKSYYDPNGNDSLQAAITALGPKIGTIIQQIRVDAGNNVKIFLVGYPDILPQSGACWPSMPFETGDAQYLNQTEKELNSMLANEASANGATFVDTYTASLNHNACTSEANRWVEPIVPASAAYPVHPNAAGEAGMAGLVKTAFSSAGI